RPTRPPHDECAKACNATAPAAFLKTNATRLSRATRRSPRRGMEYHSPQMPGRGQTGVQPGKSATQAIILSRLPGETGLSRSAQTGQTGEASQSDKPSRGDRCF